MAVMTASPIPRGREFTRADLDALPDDGNRYELLDGALIVNPAPRIVHQDVAMALAMLLKPACPAGLKVLFAPVDVVLDEENVLQPDLLVARIADFTEDDLPGAPLLAVEILSPSTRLIDLTLKKAKYAEAETPDYWVVDPNGPTLTAWHLTDGEYVEVAHVSGEESWTAESPYQVTIVPATLLG